MAGQKGMKHHSVTTKLEAVRLYQKEGKGALHSSGVFVTVIVTLLFCTQ